MTPHQFIGLGLRIFAIWLAVWCIRSFVAIPAALEVASLRETAVMLVVPIACAALAVALWLFPMWTANKLVPGQDREEKLGMTSFELAKIGCALMGLWIFSQGFLDTVWYVLRALYVSGNQSAIGSLDPSAKLEFVIAATTLAFGIALILKAATFARIVAMPTTADSKAQQIKLGDEAQ